MDGPSRTDMALLSMLEPKELWKGRPTPMEYFRVFGSKCYIKVKEDNLGKFNTRTNEGIFWDIPIVKEYINAITRA